MSKRARGGSVTGGTGDIKPQILTMSTGIAGAVDDYVTAEVLLPVPRFGAMKTKATITEILWVDWYPNIRNLSAGQSYMDVAYLSTTSQRSDGDTSTHALLQTDIGDPTVFAVVVMNREFLTSGIGDVVWPLHVDLTDGNGNGMLVATDRIFITGGNVGGATAGAYIAKMGYRMVNVGITEYIGIVQSQS